MNYLASPEDPLWCVLLCITKKRPPDFLLGVYSSSELSEKAQEELQDWCSVNCVPIWGTGIGLMEAADSIVHEAVANANIPPKGRK